MLVQLERNTKLAAVARIMLKPVKRDTCYGNSSVWFRMVVCESDMMLYVVQLSDKAIRLGLHANVA
jgi:hypothetical protein